MGGSHTLEHFANEAARDVTDPERKVPRWTVIGPPESSEGTPEEKQARARETGFLARRARDRLRLHALPAAPGIAALNIGFGGESESDGSYHSIYDSYDHYTKFDDPDFQYASRSLSWADG
jgi:N-acetylated-alpha-linked acidic dipeptidase